MKNTQGGKWLWNGYNQVNGDERKIKKLLEDKLCSRNLIQGINNWVVSLRSRFCKWTRKELILMDNRTRKLITMYKALHLRDDTDSTEEYTKIQRNFIPAASNSLINRSGKQKWDEKQLYGYLNQQRHCTWDYLNMVMKRKSEERNWISLSCTTKWYHKD